MASVAGSVFRMQIYINQLQDVMENHATWLLKSFKICGLIEMQFYIKEKTVIFEVKNLLRPPGLPGCNG